MSQWLWWCRVLRNMTRGVRMLVWRYPKHLIWLLKKACRTWILYVRGCRGKGHWFWNASGMGPVGTAATLASLMEETELIACLHLMEDESRLSEMVCPHLSHQPKDKTTIVPFLRCSRCFCVRICLVACIFSDLRCMCVFRLDVKQRFGFYQDFIVKNTLKFHLRWHSCTSK